MARGRLSMAALLAGISHLAIGTAYAASAGWDASRLPGDLKGSAVVVGAYGVFVGLKRVLRGGMAAFWTSRLGRWLIGRIAGTVVFAGLAGTGFFLAQQALDPLLDGLVRLGVPLSEGLLGAIGLGMMDRPGRGRMDICARPSRCASARVRGRCAGWSALWAWAAADRAPSRGSAKSGRTAGSPA